MKNILLKTLIIFFVLFALCQSAYAYCYHINVIEDSIKNNYVDYNKYKPEDLTSFRVLTKQFQADFEDKKGTKEAEDAYLDVIDYYWNFIEVQNKKINLDLIIFPTNGKPDNYAPFFYLLGLRISVDEGEFFFRDSNYYVYENFAPYLTKEWQELLEFDTYFDRIITYDARYVISKKEIQKIIKFYRDFSRKYPEFAKTRNIYRIIEIYEEDLTHYPYLVPQ